MSALTRVQGVWVRAILFRELDEVSPRGRQQVDTSPSPDLPRPWRAHSSTTFQSSRASLSSAQTRCFFIDGRARPDEHDGQKSARPAIDDPVTADARRPEAFEFAPQRLSDVGSVAESVDHRPDLPALVRMGGSDDGCGVAAQRYFARRADGLRPRGFGPKTSS